MSDILDKALKMHFRKGGTRCSICTNTEAAKAFHELVEARANNYLDISYVQMTELVNAELGTDYKSATTLAHVTNHLSHLHAQVRRQN